MIVSIHQPAYLPWLGYFHKVALSDVFVFFDTTQFEKNSFINRNKIKTPQGWTWLTVPVNLAGHLDKEIREIETAGNRWQEKHWRSLEMNYRRAPYWDKYAPGLKKLYEQDYKTIDEVCFEQLKVFLKFLGLDVKVIKSSEMKEFQTLKDELVMEICKELGADLYVSGSLGKDYIDESEFEKRGIKLYFQDYQHPEYEQLWGEFEPYMGVVDLLLNQGDKSLEIIMKNNLTKEKLL